LATTFRPAARIIFDRHQAPEFRVARREDLSHSALRPPFGHNVATDGLPDAVQVAVFLVPSNKARTAARTSPSMVAVFRNALSFREERYRRIGKSFHAVCHWSSVNVRVSCADRLLQPVLRNSSDVTPAHDR